jgi:hypothetical protein
MPLLSTFGAASARGFGNLSGIEVPIDDLFNTVSALLHFAGTNNGTNNVFDDSSSSNHTITANGNVTQGSFGPFARPDGAWGVAFDGSGDYLSSANSSDWALADGEWTIEAWVFIKPNGTVKQAIVGHWTNGSRGWQARVEPSGSGYKLRWTWTTDGSADTSYTGSIVADFNTWNHVAWVRASDTITLYVNGVAGGTVSGANIYTPNTPLVIGDWDSSAADFNGFISNLRLVKGTAVYTANFTPSTSKLTAITNTKLLTCQSNRFVDNSTSAHTITASGDAAVSAFGPFLTSEVYDPAVNGASAYFVNEVGEYLDTPASSDFAFGTGDFTVEFWFYQEVSGWRVLIDQVYGNLGISIWINDSRQLVFYPDNLAGVATTAAVNYNEWNHVALVRSSGVTRIYANGVSGATYSDSNNYTSTTGLTVSADYNSNTYLFKGYMSDVRAVKGTAVYTSNFTPPTAPLTAVTNTKLLLNMADGQAIDSAAQNNLTLYGDAKISSTQSKFGGTSMYFDGTGDYAYIPDGFPAFGTGDLTIEFWINPSNVTNNKVSLYDARDNQSDSPIVWQNNAGIYLFAASDRIIISSGLSVGTWAHVALVRSSGVYKLYLDGTASGTTYANTDSLVAKDLYIAGRYTADTAFYNGYIDDFRISSMARYVSNFTPPTEPFADKGQ